MGKVIVIANEKGGAGKSTIATHLIIAALKNDKKVAVFDIDNRQQTTSRFFENRTIFNEKMGLNLLFPSLEKIPVSDATDIKLKQEEDRQNTVDAIKNAAVENDLVFVDCPGADTAQSRAAHSIADAIITPVNDSFIDFDLLAKVDPVTGEITTPNFYAQMVWEAKKQKAIKERTHLEWFVIRNRLATIDAKNKRRVGEALQKLAKRIGFTILPGLSERVVYRELFPKGLTIMDIDGTDTGVEMSISNVAARQELRTLFEFLQL